MNNQSTTYMKIALNNQIDLINHGESKKFPCSTEEEKAISLKAIEGINEIIRGYEEQNF